MGKNKETLREINKLAKEFSKYEMTEAVRAEMDEILNLSDDDNTTDIIDRFVQIQDNLSEIKMITGDLIRKVNEMSEEDRKTFYAQIGVTEIEKPDQGISQDRLSVIHKMFDMVSEVVETSIAGRE